MEGIYKVISPFNDKRLNKYVLHLSIHHGNSETFENE